MSHRTVPHRVIPPRIVATGFTTAFLGDERTLREFVVGDAVASEMRQRGENAVLYFINDSLDPLNARQLRVGVNKDPALIRQFEPFCGQPISGIPDPYGCHASYSEHFLQALVDRLDQLGIHPIVINAHQAYQHGHYAPYVATTFERYEEIRNEIAEECDHYTLRNLFRIQCPRCSCIDATEIQTATGHAVVFRCERCGLESQQHPAHLRGKLSWKLDCAARWNLYGIDTEVFSKAHLAEKGTLSVSQLVSRRFYGGHIPATVRYGDLRMNPRLSGRLLEILPPALLKHLLTDRQTSDLDLTADLVMHFASTFEVRPGLSYAGYVRTELPRAALRGPRPLEAVRGGIAAPRGMGDDVLVAYGNRFSEFFYHRRYELRWPDVQTLATPSPDTLDLARDVIALALDLRGNGGPAGDIKDRLKAHLAAAPSAPGVYPFLRKAFGQKDGANITTLLAILPCEYLTTVHLILSCLTGKVRPQGDIDDAPEAEQREAA